MENVVAALEGWVGPWVRDPQVRSVLVAALLLAGLRFAVTAAQRSAARRIESAHTVHTVNRLISMLGWLVAFLMITTVFKDRLGNLTVALGVAGAGIAFALQEVIASLAGWVALSLGNFYSVGDRVKLGGIKGDVIDVGWLRTTLMELGDWVDADLYNGRIVRIANSFVFKEPVFNYSGDFPFVWDELTVPIKHGSDWRFAKELFHQCSLDVVGEYTEQARKVWRTMTKKYQIEDASVDPFVTLVANDNWLEFTVRYVTDYKKRRTTKNLLFERLLGGIEEHADKLAIASATFHLVETPPTIHVTTSHTE